MKNKINIVCTFLKRRVSWNLKMNSAKNLILINNYLLIYFYILFCRTFHFTTKKKRNKEHIHRFLKGK